MYLKDITLTEMGHDARRMEETPENHPPDAEKLRSLSSETPDGDERDKKAPVDCNPITLPTHVAGSGTLDRLVENARDYAKASPAENTNKANAAD